MKRTNHYLRALILSLMCVLNMTLSSAQTLDNVLDPAFQNPQLWTGGNYGNIEGNPYFVEYWLGANIYVGEKKYENMLVRYDTYQDNLIAKMGEGKEIVVNKGPVNGFDLMMPGSQEPLQFKKIDINGVSSYVQVIYEGTKVSLYKRHLKKVSKARVANGYQASTNQRDRFADDVDYLLKDTTNNLQVIPLSKKRILKALSDREEQVNEFLKKTKFKLKDESEIRELLKHYESL